MACEVAACRACLATDTRLLSLQDASLQHCYRTLTGDQPYPSDRLPQHLCYECAARVRRCGAFREKCLRARDVLYTLLHSQYQITAESLRSVDRGGAALLSPLQLCPQPPALPCDRNQVTPKSKPTSKNDDKKQDPDAYLSDEWIVKEIDNPNSDTSVKADIKVKSDVIEVISDSDEDKVDHYEVEINFDQFKIDYDDVKVDYDDVKFNPDDKSEVKKHLKLDATLEKKVKSKKEPHKMVKRGKPKVEKKEKDEKKKGIKKKKRTHEEFSIEIKLSHEEQLEEIRKRKNTLNYNNSPYTCELCYKGFLEGYTYENHMRRHQPSSGEYACPVCATRWRNERDMRRHVAASHEYKYACRRCDHVSYTIGKAHHHEATHKGATHPCKLCGETFRKLTSYFSHIRHRHPAEFMCDACGVSFGSKRGLATHQKKVHSESANGVSQSTYCLECDAQFSTEEAWKQHADSAKHCLSKGYRCGVCSEIFESNEALAAHSQSHVKRDTTVECKKCDKTFSSAGKWFVHNRREHLDAQVDTRRCVCEVCGKTCVTPGRLTQHQRMHTGEKLYRCSECPKRYNSRTEMQVHERTHTGERPFQCDICHSAFRRKEALQNHLWIHRKGTKRFSCNICSRGFTSYSNLKRHKEVHAGKTVTCEVCKKEFKSGDSLKLHVRHVHLKRPYPPRRRVPRPATSTSAVTPSDHFPSPLSPHSSLSHPGSSRQSM